jgi:hypothetical protein
VESVSGKCPPLNVNLNGEENQMRSFEDLKIFDINFPGDEFSPESGMAPTQQKTENSTFELSFHARCGMKFPDVEPELRSNGPSQVDDSMVLDDADEIEAKATDSNGSAMEDAGSVNTEWRPETEEIDSVTRESVPAIDRHTSEIYADNQDAVLLHFKTTVNGASTAIVELLDVKQLERIKSMTPLRLLVSRKSSDSSAAIWLK